MFVFVCFLVVQMSVITWSKGVTSEWTQLGWIHLLISFVSLSLTVTRHPQSQSVFLFLDKLKSKHPLLQARNSHICLGPNSQFSMIQQVCARQYGGRGELNIFHRLFSAAIYSDNWGDKLGTALASQRRRKSGTKRERLGPMWHVIKSRDNQKNDL